MSEDLPALSYEDALAQLESLLEAMEEGAVPLAALVEKFAEANQLLQHCEKRLEDAQLKIEKLKEKSGRSSFEELDETTVTD